jgi:autotransporter-associated beta strand protein
MKTSPITTLSAFISTLALTWASALSAQAQSGTWTNLLGGSWAAAANWGAGTIANGSANTADFSTLTLGAARTVTLDGARTIGNLTFGDLGNTYGWTLNTGTAGPLTLAVSSGSPTITVNGQTNTIGLVLAGTGGMTKSGNGMLNLSGANSYTGTTTVSAGTLTIAQGGSIASGSAISIGPAGTLTYANTPGTTPYTIGSAISGSGVWNLAPSSGVYNDFRLTGVKSGFTGTVNIGSGADGYVSSGANFFGSTATINVAAGGQMYLDSSQTYSGNFNLAGVGITGATAPVGNGRGALTMYNATINGTITLTGDASLQAGNASSGSTINAPINLAGYTLMFTNATTASGAITAAGAITGSGAVATGYSSSGAFTLTLSSTANSYAGDTTVSSPGTLTLGNSEVIPNGAGKGNVTVNGALNVNGKTETVNGLNGSGAVNGGGALTVGDNNASGSFGGIMSGVGSLTKIGSGVETLTGVNTYSGTTAVSAGKLVVSAAQTTTNTISVGDNAILGVVALGANRLKPATLTVGAATGATLEFSLVNSSVAPLSPGALVVNGTPTVNIASCPSTLAAYPLVSNYTAAILPNLGTIPASAFGYLSTNANVLYFNLTNVAVDYWTAAVNGNWDTTTPNWTNIILGNLFVNGALVQFDDTAAGASPLVVNVTSASVSPNALTVNNTNKNYVLGGNPITGIGTLTKSGPGTLTLTNVNSYTGGTAINGGTVSFGNGGLGAAGTVAFNNNAILQWNGVNTQDLSARLAISNGVTATLDTMANNVTLATAIGGGSSGGLTKVGGGTLTLAGSSGANTYTGPTIVSNGTLTVQNSLGIYSSGANYTYAGALTVASGATLNLSTTFSGAPANNHIDGTLSGSGTINVTGVGGGGYRFSGDGTAFTGALNVNVALGSLFVGATTFVNSPVTVTGNNGSFGFTALGGVTAQIGSLSGSGIVGADGGTCTFQVGNLNTDTTFSGVIKDNATTGGGVAALAKVGAGTLTLSGSSTYSGATIVNNGTLQINGSLGAGTAVAINGGTLRGVGAVNRAVNANGGGTLAAGTNGAVGTLTIGNALTLNGGSTNWMRISKNNNLVTNDIIQTTGLLTYGGTLVVNDITSDGNPLVLGDIFTLFKPATHVGSFAATVLPALPPGLGWDVSQLASGGRIAVANFAATPIFSLAGGSYIGQRTVAITCTSPGVTIHYTTNNTVPDLSSPSGASGVTVTVPLNTTMTIQAYAIGGGFSDSAVAVAAYTTVASPAVPTWLNPAGGSWAAAANWSNSVVAGGLGDTADFGQLALAADATVTLDGARTVGNLAFDDQNPTKHAWTLIAGTGEPLTLAVNTGAPVISNIVNTTIGLVLAGNQGLTKAGTGTLVLTNANVYTGTTAISNGTLRVSGSIASTNILDNGVLDYVSSGSDININATIAGTGSITGNASTGAIGFSSPVNVGAVALAGGTIKLLADIQTTGNQGYNGTISISRGFANDTTTLQTSSGGSVTLSGGVSGNAANYSTAGTLNIDTAAGNGGVALSPGAPGTGIGNLNVASGTGLITLNGGSYRYADYSVFNGPVNLGGDVTYQPGAAWVRGVTCNGDLAGNFTLTGNFGSAAALSSGVGVNGLVFSTATSSSVSSMLAGSTGLTKTGAGVTTLEAANTYTGATTVSNGTLRVNGAISAGAVTVAGGATLGGTGTIGGPVGVQTGATLSPGPALATLTINNTLNLAPGSTATLVIKSLSGTPSNARIAGLTSLTVAGTLNVLLDGASDPLAGGESFTLFNVAPAGTFAATNLPPLAAGLNWFTPDNYRMLAVNRAPAASDFALGVAQGEAATLQIIGGKYAPTDADAADVANLLVTAVALTTPANGGAVAIAGAGSNVTYTASAAFTGTDAFTYTVSDGRGGSVTRTVTVTVTPAGTGPNVVGLSGTAPNITVSAQGIPGAVYSLQSTDSLNPVSWQDVGVTNTATATGVITLQDAAAPLGMRFYRTKYISGP